MAIRIAVMTGYLLVLLGIGWAARRRSARDLADYFLASRSLSPWVLFFTMAATNFSAFTAFGVTGSGWAIGYAFYPIMGFGTGFMALTFYLIGRPMWRLARDEGLTTPPQAVGRLTGSPALRLVFFLVMTTFTLPYLAMQPMAAGYALESLLGIPYFAGAALVTAVMLAYTFLGGFRGVAWTDVFQGGMLIVLLCVALYVVSAPFGGLTAANQTVAAEVPALFSRPGLSGTLSPGIWFGYMLLWFLCDPMFPQLFQRFFTGRSPRGLHVTMSLYPLLAGFLFLLPVSIGVIGRLTFAQLPSGASSDELLGRLLHIHASPAVEALVLTAALAALMSTLDSQLLTLSSMFVHDLWEPIRDRFVQQLPPGEVPRHTDSTERSSCQIRDRFLGKAIVDRFPPSSPAGRRPSARDRSFWSGKAFVVLLALGGLAIAYRPPATFLEIATESFTGLAVLFPTVIAALHWKRLHAGAAIASIGVGEALVVAYHFDALPTFGTLPVVWVAAASTLVLVVGSLVFGPRHHTRSRIVGRWRSLVAWAALFAAIFLASQDVWAWGDGRTWLLGYPWWVWASAGLCIVTSLAFVALTRRDSSIGN